MLISAYTPCEDGTAAQALVLRVFLVSLCIEAAMLDVEVDHKLASATCWRRDRQLQGCGVAVVCLNASWDCSFLRGRKFPGTVRLTHRGKEVDGAEDRDTAHVVVHSDRRDTPAGSPYVAQEAALLQGGPTLWQASRSGLLPWCMTLFFLRCTLLTAAKIFP